MREPIPPVGSLVSVASAPVETAGRRLPSRGVRWPAVSSPPPDAANLPGDQIKSPAPLGTARARHRRLRLPCKPDPIQPTLAELRVAWDAQMRDTRHRHAAAFATIDAWLTHLELENKAGRTLYAYERATAPLLRRHPNKRIDEFTADDIRGELRVIPPRSRYISRSIYNQLFEWAVWDDRIDKNPMSKVERMSAGRRRPKDIFSPAEIGILKALETPHGELFTILFGTGIRRGEARHLRRSHVDLARGRLMVYHGKGDKDRIIPFGVEVAQAVADLDLLERLEPNDHLWFRRRYPVGDSRRRRDPVGDSTFDRWYRQQINHADVRMLNPHQTRHTYHWWLREGGLDLEERQALMGHESPETTVRQYGRIDIEDLARKVAAL